jgi:NSS family neurotransmitter:Na+ symporter
MNKERESFGSRASVIMAMAGSAIGLGNIWRFPYMVGQYGGAAFVIVYMLASFLLCLPILLSETIIGRRSRSNTFGAMDSLAPGTKWKWLGLLTVISPIILLSYYSVVGGWSVEYLFKSCLFSFNDPSAVSGMFGRFISSIWAPIICHTVFLLLTAGVIVMGVKSGIEKFTKITIPLLFVLIVLIMIYSLSLPGAKAGVDYMVKPDFSKIDASSCAAAMGQAFFSLSLGVGTMLNLRVLCPEG